MSNKNKQRAAGLVPAWAMAECWECQRPFQQTRGEPRPRAEVSKHCPECSAYQKGFDKGYAAALAEALTGERTSS